MQVSPASGRSAWRRRLSRQLTFASGTTEAKALHAILASVRMMHEVAQQHGARFIAAIINAHPHQKPRLFSELDRLGIGYVDCSPPDVPFEHPNAYWTARHAACIQPAAQALLHQAGSLSHAGPQQSN